MKTFFTNAYVESVGVLAIVTAFGLATVRFFQSPNIEILYLLAVLVSGLRWGRRTGIFTAITSAVVFDYCFIPPAFSFAVTDLPYLVTLIGFVAVAVATSELASPPGNSPENRRPEH